MKVTAVRSKDGMTSVSFVAINDETEVEATVKSDEMPNPTFADAWSNIRDHIADELELSRDYMNETDVRRISFKDVDDKEGDEKLCFTVTCIREINGSNRPFNINTPLFEEGKCSDELVQAAALIRVEAKKYAQGDRIQGVLDFGAKKKKSKAA